MNHIFSGDQFDGVFKTMIELNIELNLINELKHLGIVDFKGVDYRNEAI